MSRPTGAKTSTHRSHRTSLIGAPTKWAIMCRGSPPDVQRHASTIYCLYVYQHSIENICLIDYKYSSWVLSTHFYTEKGKVP